jgi:tRNA(adenine34) deaminase
LNQNFSDHLWWMSVARDEANKAFSMGEVPVGCVAVSSDNKLIFKSHNLKELSFNPTGHAEIEVLRECGSILKNWRLLGVSLYVTLEPCVMCLGAMIHSRISNLYFGAYDQKFGALSLGYNIHCNKKLNHSLNVIGGIEQYNSSKIMSDFFRLRRNFL